MLKLLAIEKIELLGYDGKINFDMKRDGLLLTDCRKRGL